MNLEGKKCHLKVVSVLVQDNPLSVKWCNDLSKSVAVEKTAKDESLSNLVPLHPVLSTHVVLTRLRGEGERSWWCFLFNYTIYTDTMSFTFYASIFLSVIHFLSQKLDARKKMAKN